MSQMMINNGKTRTIHGATGGPAVAIGPAAAGLGADAATGRPGEPVVAAVAVKETVSWQVACAGIATAGGRPLASVRWKIDGAWARPWGVDADGQEHSLGAAVALRQTQLADLVHLDSAGGELHLSLRNEPDGGLRLLFVASTLLEVLGVPGGRAEWGVLEKPPTGAMAK